MAAIAIGAFTGVAPRADAVPRWLHHARTTSAALARISANWSFEIPVLVWAMAQGNKCPDHDDHDGGVEREGTVFLRKQECKKHYSKANEHDGDSWLASKPALLHGLNVLRSAVDRRICIFWHVGIDE
jgi:hypothetical protein